MRKIFNYLEIPPSRWEVALHELAQDPVSEIEIQIPWGAHQPAPGILDFSKNPNLRLEKIFQIAHRLGLKLHLTFGCGVHPQAFPLWFLQENQSQVLIPAQLFAKTWGGSLCVGIPDLLEQGFEPLRDFCEAIQEMAALYQPPEGPILEARFSAGLYDEVVFPYGGPAYCESAARYYQSIDGLNMRFQTSFRTWDQAFSESGFRLLSRRRPWFAGFDFRNIQKLLVSEKARALPLEAPPLSSDCALASKRLFLDPVLVGVLPQAVFPRMYGRHRHEPFLSAYHWAQFLFANRSGFHAQAGVVLCSKFIEKAFFESVLAAAEVSRFYFPFGFPQYDEQLQRISRRMDLQGQRDFQGVNWEVYSDGFREVLVSADRIRPERCLSVLRAAEE